MWCVDRGVGRDLRAVGAGMLAWCCGPVGHGGLRAALPQVWPGGWRLVRGVAASLADGTLGVTSAAAIRPWYSLVDHSVSSHRREGTGESVVPDVQRPDRQNEANKDPGFP
ncbi:hypothetical protein [Alicyclobacillus dauci]|uniref:Secreted protein n=1 Tax=Alicyclobacillus dauci TaxID=1475485 RepID=A0ABY6Z593_9BACL|nr:hypothetical protein [Alicyclobacillus dauci]WAH37190.1 hypothetical protein NZD86_01165 [Alicyclobacillus dauci]